MTIDDLRRRRDREFELKKLHFQTALNLRNMEIDLFWKRSSFFWLFVSVPLLPYANLIRDQHTYASITAFFGFVGSFAWSLVNRGSKRWQEHWEEEAEIAQKKLGIHVLGNMREKQFKGIWLSSRSFSVSRLTTIVSDLACSVWLFLLLCAVDESLKGSQGEGSDYTGFLPGFAFLCVLFFLVYGRTRPNVKDGVAGAVEKPTFTPWLWFYQGVYHAIAEALQDVQRDVRNRCVRRG